MSTKTPTLFDWLNAQPFTLGLSAGFFGFFAHTGVMQALTSAGLSPARITGASAGALVGGVWAAGTPLQAIEDRLISLRRSDFWDPGIGLGLLRGKRFDTLLRKMIIKDSFNACNVPFTASVFDGLAQRTVVARQGSVVRSIRASCAVPGLFQPVWLRGRPHWDGGTYDRPGLADISSDERVLLHFLTSRSPWRSHKGMQPPRRKNLVRLLLYDLPRCGPFRLELGKAALTRAREATLRALEMPVISSTVALPAL